MDGEMVTAERRGCKDTARLIGFVVPLFVLLWIVHMGYELTTEAKDIEAGVSGGSSYIALVFGVFTVVFGLIYFVVGLTIVAELAMDLVDWLKKDTEAINNQEKEQKTICQIFIQVSATMVSMSMLMWAIYYGYKLVTESQRVVIYSRLAFLIGIITMAFGFIYFIIGIVLVADSALHITGRLQQDVKESDLILDTDDVNARLLV